MGSSAVGLAMLAKLPEAQAHDLLLRHEAAYRRQNLALADLRRLVRSARARGYSEVSSRIDADGVGVAFELTPNAWAGISIAVAKHRSSPERLAQLAAMLLQETSAFSPN